MQSKFMKSPSNELLWTGGQAYPKKDLSLLTALKGICMTDSPPEDLRVFGLCFTKSIRDITMKPMTLTAAIDTGRKLIAAHYLRLHADDFRIVQEGELGQPNFNVQFHYLDRVYATLFDTTGRPSKKKNKKRINDFTER
jgi:hypothetical protein